MMSDKKLKFKGDTMTTKILAKQLNKPIDQINKALVEIGYQKKVKGGFELKNPKLGEQKRFKNKKGFFVYYIDWKPFIASNNKLLKSLGLEEVKKEEIEKTTSIPKKDKEVKVFDRALFQAKYRTEDGHFVRSKAEALISNWLYNNFIVYAYEKRVPIREELYSDFYIPQYKIYIEYWGLEEEKYKQRKAKKIELYKKYNINLISLTEKEVENLDDYLPLKLLDFGMSLI